MMSNASIEAPAKNDKVKKPVVWAVGGGKGGVGKSVISTLLAITLSEVHGKCVLVDTDFGGANIHTLMGIKSPARTINDFINKRFSSLEDTRINTDIPNLSLICGASEVLSIANIQYAQKMKIIQGILNLDADNVILDLGAGTSFNVLDLFLVAHKQIVVLTPQPVSIQNAYAFVRNAVYRKLSRQTSQKPSLQSIVKTAMDPKNNMKMQTVKELLDALSASGNPEDIQALKDEIRKIMPILITNMAREQKDENAGRIIKIVSEKYLMIDAVNLCSVAYNQQINAMVSAMKPLTRIERSNMAFESAKQIFTTC